MLRRVVCLPGQSIVTQGHVAKELYFLESGHVQAKATTATEEDADEDDFSNDPDVEVSNDDNLVHHLDPAAAAAAAAAAVPEVKESLNEEPGDHGGSFKTTTSNTSVSDDGSSRDASVPSARPVIVPRARFSLVDGEDSQAPTRIRSRVGFHGHDLQSAPSIVMDDEEGQAEVVLTEIDQAGLTFGDVGVVFGIQQEATVEAIVPSQCLVLQKVGPSLNSMAARTNSHLRL